mmetsp:Transcript_81375/g.230540  ORF Transcript_81375/g.230540 Transcript_81375/m.230540 type:complete len:118 (+) Transcript_81375:58-411(+)
MGLGMSGRRRRPAFLASCVAAWACISATRAFVQIQNSAKQVPPAASPVAGALFGLPSVASAAVSVGDDFASDSTQNGIFIALSIAFAFGLIVVPGVFAMFSSNANKLPTAETPEDFK